MCVRSCIHLLTFSFKNFSEIIDSTFTKFQRKVPKIEVKKGLWSDTGTQVPLILQVFSSTGHRPASLCHGPLSVVHVSMRLSVC